MSKYLKPEQDYIDLYDRHTVEHCRGVEKLWNDVVLSPYEGKELSEEQSERMKSSFAKFYLRIEAGERYLNKSSTIREWMERDRHRDELLETTDPPEGIRCLTCHNLMKATYKDLHTELDKPDRVFFMYDCPNQCLPRRAFYSDGEEWRIKPNLCPKCDTKLEQAETNTKEKLVTTYTCPKCQYSKTDELIWTQTLDEIPDEHFAADRDRFCMTDEDGAKYQDEKWSMKRMAEFSEEWKEEERRRAEKLATNPKGFHLDGAGYTCFICGNHTPEGDNWYDEYGIKCLVCQKAIDDGEIPASLAKDKESWYSKYDLESSFNLKGPTLRKWIKEGLIKPRVISHYGQGSHYELFLIEDNEGFLPPKELVKSRSVSEVKDGKTYHGLEPWYRFVDPVEHLSGYRIMEHLRVVPPEEVKAQEEEKKRKQEEKQARRNARSSIKKKQ